MESTGQLRTPLQVMKSVLTALIIRDIQKKFITSVNTNRSIGFLWLFLEPMMHVAAWTVVRLFYGMQLNSSLSLPLFILLGALPFLMFRNISKSINLIASNKGLLIFRQIKIFDIVLSLILSNAMVMMLVYVIILFGYWWFDLEWFLYYPLQLFCAYIAYTIFLFGISLILSVVGFFFKFIERFWMVIMRVMYLTSGIFFPAESIPPAYRDYFLLNPVFQIIEISRESFAEIQPYFQLSSLSYLWQVAIIILFLGTFCYLSLRHRVMVEIEQR